MNYQLLATDMDGTLLNDEKQISPENITMINRALKAGKHIVFCSGRCIGELEEFFPYFPDLRYIICESGAEIYDLKEKRFIYQKLIDPTCVQEIYKNVEGQDIMTLIMIDSKINLSKKNLSQLEHFHIEQYTKHFDRCASVSDSSWEYCRERDWNAGKICLFHPDTDQREITKERIRHLPVSLAYSEATSLEVSPEGIDKGLALEVLCRHLNIPVNESIAIGDFYNDLEILKKAGLSIAMGNAIDPIREICDVTVADCNHSGVAEAIETYLL